MIDEDKNRNIHPCPLSLQAPSKKYSLFYQHIFHGTKRRVVQLKFHCGRARVALPSASKKLKIRLLIILVGAITAAGVIHWFQEQDRTKQRGRFRERFQESGPRDRNASPPPQRGGQRSPGGMQVVKLKAQFDQDGDSILDDNERARALKFIKEMRTTNRGFPAFSTSTENLPRPGETINPSEISAPQIERLYDENTIHTLFIDFNDQEWESELEAFWKTDVDVPAQLIANNTTIGNVGVRFRGTSSFFTVNSGMKRSFNIAIDHTDPDQRFFGYKTLNLLNSHTDPSFVRSILFNHIASHYIPAEKVNFVKLVINRENWGIYINSQQFNKDFLDEWFGTKKGIRWKMLPNPRGGNGFNFEGTSPVPYQNRYIMKSKGGDAEWAKLIRVFKILHDTNSDELIDALEPVFNIDRALWFLALENVFIDNDGYWARASDFAMYMDNNERLHMILHDSNETFQRQAGRNQSKQQGTHLDPLFGLNDKSKPLIHKLLNVPTLQARYLAHVRTIRDEWLDWDLIAPLVRHYHRLIDDEIRQDTRKHDSYESFRNSLTEETETQGPRGPRNRISLKRFIVERSRYLDQYPPLAKAPPQIEGVEAHGEKGESIIPGEAVEVRVTMHHANTNFQAMLYFSDRKHIAFKKIAMKRDGNRTFLASIPPRGAGQKVHYYVEVSDVQSKTMSFAPPTAEFSPMSYRVEPPIAKTPPILINEIMPSNTATIAAPDGDFDDWIELRNMTPTAIDLTGYYLSDNDKNPKKWRFPENSTISGNGYLLIWADEDGNAAAAGLHANFKLSRKGESVSLYDRDEQDNRRLDRIVFKSLDSDQAWGRNPNEITQFRIQKQPSPGTNNLPTATR